MRGGEIMNFLTKQYTKVQIALRSEKGQGMVEYGLILGLVTVGCIIALTNIGTSIATQFGAIVTAL
jgi:pilus assembly protein Flp/PilA